MFTSQHGNYVKFQPGDQVILTNPTLAISAGTRGLVIPPTTDRAWPEPRVIVSREGRPGHWVPESYLELADPPPTTHEIAALFGIRDSDPYGEALHDAWMAFNKLTVHPHLKDHVSLRFNAEFLEALADLMGKARE